MPLNKNSYKNIIFDLGGVILNIDYSLAANAFKNLGITDFEELYSQTQQNKLFDLFEKGQLSSSHFRAEIKKQFKKNIEDLTIDTAWNAMLLDLPPERLELLQSLKNTHRTFLLSNTNDIHIRAVNSYLKKTFGIPDLSGYFKKMYLSYEIGKRKPDAEIFEQILLENRLAPSETLFIDDSIQHIEGAKKQGIQTYWLQKGETILDLF